MAESKKALKTTEISLAEALTILTGLSAAELKAGCDVKAVEKEAAKMFRRSFSAVTDPSNKGRIESVIMIETA